jgi:type I restriction enzyme, R subunit
MTPEKKARLTIDGLLARAGWRVCGMADANIHAARGVAIREFPLNSGFGFADYMLYVDGKACGVIEAKKEGSTLAGVEAQSGRYSKGLPTGLPAWHRPLPFLYESRASKPTSPTAWTAAARSQSRCFFQARPVVV